MANYFTWSSTAITTTSTDSAGASLALPALSTEMNISMSLQVNTATLTGKMCMLTPYVKDSGGTKVWEGETLVLALEALDWNSVSGWYVKHWQVFPALVGIIVGANFTCGITVEKTAATGTANFKGEIYY